MKHIKFKRKAKAFATLGGLATVSSLVLAACSDNSTSTTTTTETKKDTVSAEIITKATKFVDEQMTGLKLLESMEKTHFADLVEKLNFEKGLNQNDLEASKTKLGDEKSTELTYAQDANADAKKTALEATDMTVYGILKKMLKDVGAASKKTGNDKTVTDDELAAFTKTVNDFKTAATTLVSKFSTLPQNDSTTTELTTKAKVLAAAVSVETFNASNIKTKMNEFVTEVKTQRTNSTALVDAALGLTKATADLQTFANTNIAKFVASSPDFSLELNRVVALVTDEVLGKPGPDLFVNAEEVPSELQGKEASVKLYKVFAKLFRVNESLADLTNSYQRLSFVDSLVKKDDDAIKVFAKNIDGLKFNVDFARLNAFLSFDNTNLLSVFNNGPQRTSGSPIALKSIADKFKKLELDLEYISGTGENTLTAKLNELKKADDTHSSQFDGVTTQITTDNSKFTEAIAEVKKANAAFTKLSTDILELNLIIRSSNGFEGILQLLSKVEDIKKDITTIHELFKKTSDTENDSVIITKIKAVKTISDLSGTLGSKLKTLYEAIEGETGDKKTNVEAIVKLNTQKDQYESGTYKDFNDLIALPATYEASLRSTASATGDSVFTLAFINALVKTSYAPSLSSETITQLTQLAAEYKAK